MKVNDILPGQQTTTAVARKPATATGLSFQNLLAQEMQAVPQPQPVAPTTAVSAVAASPAALRSEGLQLTEQTIATLDQFSDALRNPAFSAEDLEPFASALEEDSAALVELKGQLPTDDPLTKILEQAAALSWMEAAKFRRGDYHA